MKRILFGTGVCFWLMTSAAMAFDCSPLSPATPQNQTTEFTGKINGELDGLFSGIVGAQANLEGSYKSALTSILPNFPSADKLYIWERMLFIQCNVIAEARDMTSQEKIESIGEIYKAFSSPPLVSGDGASISNSGNNNVNVVGSDNTINSN